MAAGIPYASAHGPRLPLRTPTWTCCPPHPAPTTAALTLRITHSTPQDPNKDMLRLYAVPGDAFEAHYQDE